MKGILIILLSFSSPTFAQVDTINQYNDAQKKDGYWIVYGYMKPEKGYPDSGLVQHGTYINDRKTGIWTFYYPDGITPKLQGTFKNGRPNGPYFKYWNNGNLKEEGIFTGGKQTDIICTFYENGCIMQDHIWVDSLNKYTAVFYHPDCVTDSSFIGTVEFIFPPPEDSKLEVTITNEVIEPMIYDKGRGGPSGSKGKTKDGKKFDANGYNKVYNIDDEIWMDGKFKYGKLWDGKLYKYDSDGILEKIEIWKEGNYHSDGQL